VGRASSPPSKPVRPKIPDRSRPARDEGSHRKGRHHLRNSKGRAESIPANGRSGIWLPPLMRRSHFPETQKVESRGPGWLAGRRRGWRVGQGQNWCGSAAAGQGSRSRWSCRLNRYGFGIEQHRLRESTRRAVVGGRYIPPGQGSGKFAAQCGRVKDRISGPDRALSESATRSSAL